MAVFVFATMAFEAGVGADARPGIPEAGFLTHLYYSLGLFVLGGMDLGMPTGGPPTARALLWVSYFLGPLVTTTAVAEGVLRVMRPESVRRARLRHHIVLIGLDRVGMRYLDAVREVDPERWVLAVDTDLNHRSALADRLDRRTLFAHRDVTEPRQRPFLRLEHADGVIVASGDDLVNLEVAWELASAYPTLPICALVGDIGLRRGSESVRRTGSPTLFNMHRMVAAHLYRTGLQAHFQNTQGLDTVVIAGFGRFGQTIAEYLHHEAFPELSQIVVVDLHAQAHAARFTLQTGADCLAPDDVLDGDMTDPTTWKRVDAALRQPKQSPVRILCAEHDDLNLQTAMLLRRQQATGRIFVRVFHDGPYVRAMAERYDFEVLAVDHTLAEAFAERHREWFGA